ncbi:MAG: response regulator transcription factor [Granulosicoccus sp.]
MRKTIALVEDDDILRQNYVDLLEDNLFFVTAYASRLEAEAAFEKGLPDLALLDIGLNEEREGGYDLCRFIRRRSESLPIIFLTAYNKDVDEISGLRMGADDYISKEESFEKILVRINSLFRRVAALSDNPEERGQEQAENQVQHGDLYINMASFEIRWKDIPIKFPLTQLWILHSLARRPGQVKSRESLMDAANITHSGLNTITVHINAIRNKFKEVDADFDRIKNERGIGYSWS